MAIETIKVKEMENLPQQQQLARGLPKTYPAVIEAVPLAILLTFDRSNIMAGTEGPNMMDHSIEHVLCPIISDEIRSPVAVYGLTLIWRHARGTIVILPCNIGR